MINEIWSVEYDEIKEFLSENCFVLSNDCFAKDGVVVRLEQLPLKALGTISLPKTRIEISGSEKEIEEFYKKFKLRFLKGGA